MSITVSSEADEAISSFLKSPPEGEALIFTCDKKQNSILLEERLKFSTPEDIAEELPESSPRIILHRYVIGSDGEAAKEKICYIFYNPLSTSVDLKRLYTNARNHLTASYTNLKQFGKEIEFNDIQDFSQTTYKTKIFGLQGKEGKPLPGQKSTGGGDGRL